VVVDDLDVEGVTINPAEDDAPLLIDPNAVKPVEVTAQSFEVVARRYTQVVQVAGSVDELQLAERELGHNILRPTQ
jgi:hypothetical protein